MNRLIAATLLGLTVATPGVVSAQTLEDGGQLYAIQNRKYVMGHEFAFNLGTVPLDAFYKGMTFTGSYTYHFSDEIAWEIIQGTYSLNFNTSLRNSLENDFGVEPTEFPELRVLFDSNILWKPFYGKAVFRNSDLIYGEAFFTAGPAIASYVNVENLFIGVNAGIGGRVYLSKAFAIRSDIRWYQIANTGDFSDWRGELLIQVGIGLNIR